MQTIRFPLVPDLPGVLPIDIWRAVNLMIEMFAGEAALKAAMRADALLEQGDTEGFFA